MSDRDEAEKNLNPHTGQPIPGEPAPPPRAGAASPAPGASATANAASPAGPTAAATPAGHAPFTSSAPSQQEMAIRSALETVMDPEIALSVIDLGLIREIHVQPDKTLIRMMMTTPFCPYAPQMVADVKEATMSVVPQPCEVDVLADPWSPDLMPDPGLLGFSY